jgi:hypothetical protein
VRESWKTSSWDGVALIKPHEDNGNPRTKRQCQRN